MNEVISLEVRFFLVSLLSGVLLLVIYDILRIIRIILKQGAIQIGIQDFIFWVASGVFIFRMMYRMNDGVIRGFSIVGIFLGMVMYKYSISDWMVQMLSKAILTLIKWIKKAFKIMISPFVWLGKQAIRFLKFLGKKFEKAARFVEKIFEKLVITRYMGLKNRAKSYKMKRESQKEQKRALRAEKKKTAKKDSDQATFSEDASAYTESVARQEPMAVAVHQARVTSKVVQKQR